MGLLHLDTSCLPKPQEPLPCWQGLQGALGWAMPLVPWLGVLWSVACWGASLQLGCVSSSTFTWQLQS